MKKQQMTIEPASATEKAVLGSMIMDKSGESIGQAIDVGIRPEHFAQYTEAAAAVFQAYNAGNKISVAGLMDALTRTGLSRSEVNEFVVMRNTATLLDDFDTLKQEHHRRVMYDISTRLCDSLKSGVNPYDAIADADMERERVSSTDPDGRTTRVNMVNNTLDGIMQKASGKMPAFKSTGITELDEMIFGIGVPRVRVVAAGGGEGKTTYAWNEAITAAQQKMPVIYYSLEMSFDQLFYKYLHRETGIFSSRIYKATDLTKDEIELIHRTAAKFYDLDIYVEDAMFDYADIVSSVRRNIRKNGIQMVYVDYVGLLEDRAYKGYNVNDKISKISRAFVKLSATEKVEVVLLSQYSRSRVGRADPKPLNSDLRDSGSLEQDPQVIMHLYRPEKFGINEDADGNSYRGVTIIVVSKNRLNNQGVGDIAVGYDNKRDGFTTILDEQPAPTYNALITTSANAGDDDIPF